MRLFCFMEHEKMGQINLSEQATMGMNALLEVNKYSYNTQVMEAITQFLASCCEQMKQPCAYHLIFKINVFTKSDIKQVTDYLRRSLPSVMWLWTKEYSDANNNHIHMILVVDNKRTPLHKIFTLRGSLEEAFSDFITSITVSKRVNSNSYYHILKSEMEDAANRFGYLSKLEQKQGVKEKQKIACSRKATTTHSAWH